MINIHFTEKKTFSTIEAIYMYVILTSGTSQIHELHVLVWNIYCSQM